MSSRDETRRRRVTYQQLDSLWEFLNSHKDIAVGYNKSAQARDYAKRLWISVAESLNSQGEGATKDWKGWSNYWVDYKAKLKKRVAAICLSYSRTGGGPSQAIPLNDLEKKFLSILGEDFGSGLPNTQVDPFPNLPQTSGNTQERLEPVAGPSRAETDSSVDPLYVIEVIDDTQAQEASEVDVTAMQQVIESPTTNNANEQRQPRRSLRRRHSRQNMLTIEAARRTMVDVAKARLELHQQNSRVLEQIANTQANSLEIWQETLCTLKRIAAVMDKEVISLKVYYIFILTSTILIAAWRQK